MMRRSKVSLSAHNLAETFLVLGAVTDKGLAPLRNNSHHAATAIQTEDAALRWPQTPIAFSLGNPNMMFSVVTAR